MPSRSFLVACLLLALLHGFIGWQILPALAGGTTSTIVGILLLGLSWVLIPAGLLAHRLRRQPAADRLIWAGMLATGLFSSLLVLTLARAIGLTIAGWLGWHSMQLVQASALAVPVLAFVITAIGFINARRTAQVVRVDVPIAGLPEALEGFTIAQITDIHVGPTIKRNYVQAIVARVNALAPDIIAVTGDVVDGSVRELATHAAPLAQLSARHGTFLVTGNHEYYSNAHAWIAEFKRLGLRVLMNEHVVLKHRDATLVVAGVTDYSAHHFDATHKSDPHAAIAGAPDHAAVKILLAHQPRSAVLAADAGFDLQISGHTHGGQFFPWNFFVPLQQPFTAGLKRMRQMWVYTSRGTGYWGPPKRFGAPSEITLLRLVRAV